MRADGSNSDAPKQTGLVDFLGGTLQKNSLKGSRPGKKRFNTFIFHRIGPAQRARQDNPPRAIAVAVNCGCQRAFMHGGLYLLFASRVAT